MKEKIDKKKFYLAIRIAIALFLLIFLIGFVEFDAIISRLGNADKTILLIVFLLSFVNLYAQYLKWSIICNKILNVRQKKLVFHSLLYGIGAGIFTPLKVGEYLGRAIALEDKKMSDVTIATIIDKIIPISIAIIFGTIFLSYFLYTKISAGVFISIIPVIITLALIIIISYFFMNREKTFSKVNLPSNNFLVKIISKIELLKKVDLRTLKLLILISFIFHIIFTTQMALLISAFSNQSDYILYFIIANLIIFTQIIIPSIALGEIGIREGASVFFVKSYGIAGAVGFNAAISLFLFNLLLPSILGLLFMARKSS